MKTVTHAFLCILLSIIVPFPLFSQCAGGAGPFTLRYDTTLYGTGSAAYVISFPKFDIPLGTLLSADIKSVANLGYSYVIKNGSASNQTYNIKITRSDDINCSAIDPLSINGFKQTPFAPFVLVPGQELSYGPAYLGYTVDDSITTIDPHLNNFQGIGTVDFDYQTNTSAVTKLPAPGFNFSSVEIFDTVHFSISYLYCLSSVLSADLLYFTAIPQSKGKALLNWRQMTIENNRLYNVQVSTDGKNFKSVAVVTENNTGTYAYTYLHDASARLYFRIEEKNISGEIKYSNICIIDPERQPGVRVFPTRYTGGSLQFNFPYKADWRINVYSAEGKKVIESRLTGVYNAQIVLPPAVSNGIYTAEIVDMGTLQTQFTRIVVQR
ncbi:MAG: choice-of-anchor E domain-containing protein [Chitinophagaceae bacterium]